MEDFRWPTEEGRCTWKHQFSDSVKRKVSIFFPIALVSSSSAVRASKGSWQLFGSYTYIQMIFPNNGQGRRSKEGINKNGCFVAEQVFTPFSTPLEGLAFKS
ncbi:unnamed protein product [Citrullus colocynthis]|uniref:Uncharacterized protein n=1 Tax=Citrullus colocynthis TaxID=252529 RepID=A0ABP0Z7F4_9ROSI